jgi:hypothetical protein
MNTQQLLEEMQRLQMEYVANPTPENLAKMQGEMTRLQQEMMAASMQGASAAMEAAFDDGDDAAEREQFVKDHPPVPGKAKYLPIGALLLITNDEPCETFALVGDKEEWQEAITEAWDISDAAAGREMLESLLQGRHAGVFDEDYRAFKAGRSHELDEDSVEAYNDMLDTLGGNLPALLPHARACETILAWDLDRAGYLARIFAHLGWIPEEEAFDWLERIAARVKATFGSWEEYAVSVMVGRALHFESADPVIGAALELFGDKISLLDGHPVSRL